MGSLRIDRQPDLLKQCTAMPLNVETRRESSFPERASRNPFFFRNNPHPSRVRHIKGLLDRPVCSVMDSGYREGVPNLENQLLLATLRKNEGRRKKRETFIPGIGLVTIQPTWVEQLRVLTRKVKNANENTTKTVGPPETLQKSSTTKPPSRQASRGSNSRVVEMRAAEEDFVRSSCSREANVKFEDAFSRKSLSRGKVDDGADNLWSGLVPAGVRLEDHEVSVARLLSHILNTDSLDVIKRWLTEAPEKEKEVVLEMLRNVSHTNLEFREVMNKLSTNQGEDNEKMPGIKDVNISPRNMSSSNSPRSLSREKENSNVLDVIKENIEADLKTSRKSGRNSQRMGKDIILPPIVRDDLEIEVLRSRLASRSNINVFPTKSSRCCAR